MASAQLWTSVGADVHSNGQTIRINGDVKFETGSTISGTGGFQFEGDWTNNSSSDLFGTSDIMVQTTGVDQTITGSQNTMFPTLILGGTGGVFLEQDISVGGTSNSGPLFLAGKVLHLQSQNVTVTTPFVSAISTVPGSYIVSETGPGAGYGSLTRAVDLSSAITYTWPFGDFSTDTYIPVVVSFYNGNSGSGTVTISTYPTDPSLIPNNRPLPTGVPSTVDLAGNENSHNCVDRWWIVETNGLVVGPSGSLQVHYRDEDIAGNNTIDESALKMQRNENGLWSQPALGISNPPNNSVGIGTSSWDGAWAAVNSFALLPIELLEFNVSQNEEAVQCLWKTASEVNNDYFTVERASEDGEFHPIGYVDGAGTSQSTRAYAFVDQSPIQGLNYYRLRQTDFSGINSVSEVRSLYFDVHQEAHVAVYPNPTNSRNNLVFSLESKSSVSISCCDNRGRRIEEPLFFEMEAGQHQISLLWNHLDAGSYMMTVETKYWIKSVRFLIQ